MKEICTFYGKIYKSKHIYNNEINSYLSGFELDRKLNEKEKSFLVMKLLLFINAKKSYLKDIKSPGIDEIRNVFE